MSKKEAPAMLSVPVKLSFVTFFAMREIIAEMAEAKGDEADSWKKRLEARIATEMGKFSTRDGKPVDGMADEETRSYISTLLRDPKKDVS